MHAKAWTSDPDDLLISFHHLLRGDHIWVSFQHVDSGEALHWAKQLRLAQKVHKVWGMYKWNSLAKDCVVSLQTGYKVSIQGHLHGIICNDY